MTHVNTRAYPRSTSCPPQLRWRADSAWDPAIAEIHIPAGCTDVVVHKTRGSHHFTVIGNAQALKALVVRVHSLDSEA